jgi:hypothetical protein
MVKVNDKENLKHNSDDLHNINLSNSPASEDNNFNATFGISGGL